MSIIPAGVTLITAAIDQLLPLVFFRPRSIGGIIANCTIEEKSSDRLAITQHPVEQGASIADHSFKVPAALTIVAGWSNASLQALGDPNYVISIYDALLDLQSTRQPFDVITGKRLYTSMLMKSIYQTTDEKTEQALLTVLELEEIIIVSTQTVSVPSAKNMKNPQANEAQTNTGSKQLTSAPNYNNQIDPNA